MTVKAPEQVHQRASAETEVLPPASTMLICTSVPRPTDPGLRASGGRGLDAI